MAASSSSEGYASLPVDQLERSAGRLIKRMTMLVRRDDLTGAAFSDYWQGKHADIARRMPRLHRYVQNHFIRSFEGLAEDPGFWVHGIPELWFLDEEAKTAAFASPAAKLLPEDEKNFIQGITILAVDEQVLREGAGAAKVLLLMRRAAPVVDGAAEERWLRALTGALGAARRVVINRVLSSEHRPGVWHEPAAPDMIIELRFDSAADAEKGLLSPGFATRLAEMPSIRAAAYLVNEYSVLEPAH
jgi:uncharacterized protein (TIGR02118 family)